MLVRDRVELSEEYLAVIDEVERLLEEENTKHLEEIFY